MLSKPIGQRSVLAEGWDLLACLGRMLMMQTKSTQGIWWGCERMPDRWSIPDGEVPADEVELLQEAARLLVADLSTEFGDSVSASVEVDEIWGAHVV